MFGSKEEFSPDPDWGAVLQEATAQTVIGITAKALPAETPAAIRSKWDKLALAQLANNIRYWKAQDDLHQLLTENGIPYVILKGAAAAMLYPDPLSRAMGDIDFLVAPEYLEQATTLLEKSGYRQHHEGERHIVYDKDHVLFELHRRFSYDDLDMEDTLQAAIPHAELQKIDGHEFFTLPATENGLVLLGHLWNHLHRGIGLRQILDWMLFVHTYGTDDFWMTQFSNPARQYHLATTAVTVTAMCRKYFHLPDPISWCASAEEDLCDELMKTVLDSGNFGRKQPFHSSTEGRVQGALDNLNRYGFFRYLQKAGEINWAAYHKHPRLKPFAWLYQIFRYAFLWLVLPKHQKLTTSLQKGAETSNLFKHLNQ